MKRDSVSLLQIQMKDNKSNKLLNLKGKYIGGTKADQTDDFRCAGLQSEDLIVAINGQNVQSLSHDQLVMKLKAFPVDSLVTLTIKRQAEPSPSSIASRNRVANLELEKIISN